MKITLWISFYFLAFVAMVAGIYMSKDKLVEKTQDVPVLNYTDYHRDAMIADTSYVESIDSLAVVIEGLLSELTGYVSQLNERDNLILTKNREINRLRQENAILKKQIAQNETSKISYTKAQEQKRIQDLANTLSTMKPEVLGPILKNLPDDLIKILFDKAKKNDKAVIFKAMPAERAGAIMAQMTGHSKTRAN